MSPSRSLRWKDYKPEPLKSDHLVCPFQVGSWACRLGYGLQVPKVVEDTGVTLSLSSVEGLQTGTPQVGSSGLPIPSRELGLSARAFKFLKWWRTPVSPSRSLRWKDYRPEPQSQSNNHIFRPLRFFLSPHPSLVFYLQTLHSLQPLTNFAINKKYHYIFFIL